MRGGCWTFGTHGIYIITVCYVYKNKPTKLVSVPAGLHLPSIYPTVCTNSSDAHIGDLLCFVENKQAISVFPQVKYILNTTILLTLSFDIVSN